MMEGPYLSAADEQTQSANASFETEIVRGSKERLMQRLILVRVIRRCVRGERGEGQAKSNSRTDAVGLVAEPHTTEQMAQTVFC